MPYATITSRKANEDYQNIKSSHADLVMGMTNQKIKVDQYNQQKQQEQQAVQQQDQMMQQDMQKTQMANDTTQQKNVMDFSVKQQELEIKKSALAQP